MSFPYTIPTAIQLTSSTTALAAACISGRCPVEEQDEEDRGDNQRDPARELHGSRPGGLGDGSVKIVDTQVVDDDRGDQGADDRLHAFGHVMLHSEVSRRLRDGGRATP
jgi:hypothetical protein